MPYDLAIRNGIVVDGSGRPRRTADVGIRDGIVVDVGRLDGTASRTIDAEGMVVTPGFVDGHTHLDAQLMWDPLGTPSCWHGVTSVVIGNCGFTLAPVHADATNHVVRNLERAEDIPAAAIAAGVRWEWQTFPEYLDVLDALPKGINVAANIGHSALRTWAMGERAFGEPATRDDMARMSAQLEVALTAGAIGFTTSRSGNHETSDGRPVASRSASWDEVMQLVDVLGRMNRGVFQLAKEPAATSVDPDERAEFAARLLDLAIATGVPTTFGIQAKDRPGWDWRGQLAMLDRAHAAGARMFGMSHSRGVSLLSSFRSRMPFDGLPQWAAVRRLSLAEQRAALHDADLRRRLVDEAHRGRYGTAIGAEARRPDFDTMQVLQQPVPPNPTVADLARSRGLDPVDVIIDESLAGDFHTFFVQPLDIAPLADSLEVLRHPHVVMTFSDAGAHVGQISDCSIQTHLLAFWVRQEQAITLEAAVQMITDAPARAWGLTGRGLVASGMIADINVFDADRVAPELPSVSNDLPTGAMRLIQRSRGFAATVVGGQVTLVDGERTGALPGCLIRGGAAR